jgi:predicted dehydrogenase
MMRFGVIGWGLRSYLAKQAHQPPKDWYLVALADPSEIARADFCDKIDGDPYVTDDYRNLLDKDLDAIFVLSPDWLHEEQAVTILNAGISVYLEKPMAITVEGCDRILEAAANSKGRLYVGHNMRWFGVVRKMKEWIDAGHIGEVKTAWCRHFVSYGGEAYFRDWHADRTLSNGLLLQKGSHDIDVMHWLCNGYSERVSAMGKLMVYGDNQDRQLPGERIKVEFKGTWPPSSLDKLYPTVDVEDVSMMLMELDNGVLASYQQCHFTPDAWRNYTVIGSHGRIENFGDAPGKCVVRLWEHNTSGYALEGDLEYRVPMATGGHGGADELILEEFVRFVRDGGTTDTSPIAARMSVAAGVAGTESLRSGNVPVIVRPLPACAKAFA